MKFLASISVYTVLPIILEIIVQLEDEGCTCVMYNVRLYDAMCASYDIFLCTVIIWTRQSHMWDAALEIKEGFCPWGVRFQKL